ncbi:Cytochrome oxidase assembly [Coemansia erecta]|nr:Cytochrome oxidase assembly [Coemansia sp. RSA 2618]KAJ2829821.1 Cytochrome oxidase assembly [Coemansia erecta]
MHKEIPSSNYVHRRRVSKLQRLSKKHPFLCVGLPFMLAVVGGSFVLLPLQETKYEVQDKRVSRAAREDLLPKNRKKFDIQEEYFKMKSQGVWGEWEPKRVDRPPEDEPVWDRQQS